MIWGAGFAVFVLVCAVGAVALARQPWGLKGFGITFAACCFLGVMMAFVGVDDMGAKGQFDGTVSVMVLGGFTLAVLGVVGLVLVAVARAVRWSRGE